MVVPDNVTRTDVDLGKYIGGKRIATAEFKGNTLVTYLHRLNDDTIDVISTQIVNPDQPNTQQYSIMDVQSRVSLIQVLDRII